MEPKVNYAAVGAFVIGLGLAGTALVVWLLFGDIKRDYDPYLVYFTESIAGLQTDSVVRYRGVEVGRVAEIELAPDNPERVRLLVQIEHGTPIKTDTLATLSPQGLTGIYYVELTGGSRAADPLEADPGQRFPVIDTKPSLLFRIDQALTGLTDSLQGVTENLNTIINQANAEKVANSLENIERFSQALGTSALSVEQLMANAASSFAEIDELASNINDRSEEIDIMLASLSATSSNVAQASEDFNALIANAKGVAASLQSVSAKAANFLESSGPGLQQFATGTLTELNLLLEESRQTLNGFQEVLREVDDQPNVLLFGRRPAQLGPGEEG